MAFASCNWAKEKTNQTVNKAGEVVAKTGSEFAEGFKKGVEKTLQHTLQLSDELKKKGLSTGKVIITSSDSASDHILSAYLIFDQPIEQAVTLTLFSEDQQEYGRITQTIKGQKGEAKYIDFVFDKRTHINEKSTVRIK